MDKNKNNSGTEIDEKKLAEAMEKLACHIAPPKPKADDHADPQAVSHASSAGVQEDFIDAEGRVRLTRMTAAGG